MAKRLERNTSTPKLRAWWDAIEEAAREARWMQRHGQSYRKAFAAGYYAAMTERHAGPTRAWKKATDE